MGDELANQIIQLAEEMRAHGHTGVLVAVVGDGIDLQRLVEVITPKGDVLVRQHPDLAAPNTIAVMTQKSYQELLNGQ